MRYIYAVFIGFCWTVLDFEVKLVKKMEVDVRVIHKIFIIAYIQQCDVVVINWAVKEG